MTCEELGINDPRQSWGHRLIYVLAFGIGEAIALGLFEGHYTSISLRAESCPSLGTGPFSWTPTATEGQAMPLVMTQGTTPEISSLRLLRGF